MKNENSLLSLDEMIKKVNNVSVSNEIKKVEEIDTELNNLDDNKENCIIYDYFSVTAKFGTANDLIKLLGLDDIEFQCTKGFNFFRQRFYYKGLSIHYDYYGKDEQLTCMLEMSGEGCRMFETFGHGDWDRLFTHFLRDSRYKITRLDVAYDDHTGVLDVKRIATETLNENFIARARTSTVEYSTILKKKGVKLKGTTVYIGSKKSDVLIRFYNKAVERGYTDRHWVRCEIQLRRDRATQFLLTKLSLGEKFSKVLNNYVRYVDVNENDLQRKDRWKTSQFWLDFVKTTEKISIYTKKTLEYNLPHIEKYIFNQAGNSIYTYIKCLGMRIFMQRLKKRTTKLQYHQEALIINYNKYRTDNEKETRKQADNPNQ